MDNNIESERQYNVRKEASPMTLIRRLPRNGKIMSSRGRDQAGSMLWLGQMAHTYNSLWRSQDNWVESSPFSSTNT